MQKEEFNGSGPKHQGRSSGLRKSPRSRDPWRLAYRIRYRIYEYRRRQLADSLLQIARSASCWGAKKVKTRRKMGKRLHRLSSSAGTDARSTTKHSIPQIVTSLAASASDLPFGTGI